MHKQNYQYSNIAIIMAAGQGERLDAQIPKQYINVAGESILRRIVKKFVNHELIDATIVVINANHIDRYQHDMNELDVLPYVIGGARRQDSVRNALEVLSQYSPQNVLIHDAARAFVVDEVITNVIKALEDHEGAIAAAKLVDTLKYVEADVIEKTIARDNLFLAQTPQGFHYEAICDLHRKYKDFNFTDDAGLFEHVGKKVKVVNSSLMNFKITTADDLILAQNILEKENA